MSTTLLDDFIEPLAECMTAEAAQKIVGVQTDAATQGRIDELAQKANQGILTEAEKAEYDHFLDAYHFISVMQARARRLLKS